MQALILAAGMATRLRPLTDKCPKCLLEVKGKTLLRRTLDAILGAGIKDITIVTGYKAEMIKEFAEMYIKENTTADKTENGSISISFIHNADYSTTNNIYSLWLAKDKMEGKDFLLMDSDIYCDPMLVKTIVDQKVSALALNRHECGEEEIKVIVDGEGNITEISKVCSREDAIGESVGVERMTAEYSVALYRELDIMCGREGLTDVFYERAFERLIPQGHTFRVVDTTDFFSMELDTVEDFETASKM